MNVNLERVIRFVAVAEEMSFTAAAKKLRVDQPWLSRQIHQLEEQLGFVLFERTTRRIELTPEGATFLEQAKRLADTAEETVQVARALERGRREELTLAALSSTFWVPARAELIERFTSLYPRTTIAISLGTNDQVLKALAENKADVGFVVATEDISRFDYLRLHWSRPGLFIPREHPITQKNKIRMADLAGLPLASTRRSVNGRAFEEVFAAYLEAGMIEREIPEGGVAVSHYAHSERLCVVALNLQEDFGDDMVLCEVVDTIAVLEFGLVRRLGDERMLVRRLWSAAKQLAEESGMERASDPGREEP